MRLGERKSGVTVEREDVLGQRGAGFEQMQGASSQMLRTRCTSRLLFQINGRYVALFLVFVVANMQLVGRLTNQIQRCALKQLNQCPSRLKLQDTTKASRHSIMESHIGSG